MRARLGLHASCVARSVWTPSQRSVPHLEPALSGVEGRFSKGTNHEPLRPWFQPFAKLAKDGALQFTGNSKDGPPPPLHVGSYKFKSEEGGPPG